MTTDVMTHTSIDDRKAQIGATLRATRPRAGVKQSELAAALGIDRTTLARYEGGSRSIPLPILLRICHVLQTPLDDLLPDARLSAPQVASSTAHADTLPAPFRTIIATLLDHPQVIPTILEALTLLLERDALDEYTVDH